MKTIAYSILVYFSLVSIFKFLGDFDKNDWVNYYWIVSSAFFGFIFLKIRSFCKINYVKNLYNKKDLDLYKAAITTMAIYWGIVILGLRIYVAFNIELYDTLISGARNITVGGITIILIFIFLFFKTIKRK